MKTDYRSRVAGSQVDPAKRYWLSNGNEVSRVKRGSGWAFGTGDYRISIVDSLE